METFLAVGISALLTAAVTSGIWFAITRRSQPDAVESSAPDESRERLEIYQSRLNTYTQWLKGLSSYHQMLAQTTTLDEMAQGLKQIVTQSDVKKGVLLAINPPQDVAPLDVAGRGARPQNELAADAFIVSYPDIEGDLLWSLAGEIFTALRRNSSAQHRWWLLRDLAPDLQDHLLKRFHLAGQGIVIPLRYQGTLHGLSLITGVEMEGGAEAIRESGERLAVMGDMLAAWLHSRAVQLSADAPRQATPELALDALTSLDNLENAIAALQEEAESQEMLGALADYSHFSMERIAERSLLATQTCSSLRRICQADFAMLLLPEGKGNFAVEAIEFEDWSWSHFAALQGRTTQHALIRDERVLKSWPDAFARQSYDTGQIVHAVKQGEVFTVAGRLSNVGLESVLVKPATLNQSCQALLVVGMKTPGGFPESVLAVTASVAAIAAMSLKTMEVTNERNTTKQALEDMRRVSSTITKQSVEVLGKVAAAHGILTVRRPEEVAKFAVAIGEQLSISKEQIYQLRLAALTCDIGMVAVPSSLLRKEGGFTTEEWKVIQAHPQMSVNILKDFTIFKEALQMILHHHERWDGTGYPDNLKGADIPFGARILAVADSYVSMQTKRPYRGALTAAEALEQIQREAETHFDPDIVKALLRVLRAEQSAAA